MAKTDLTCRSCRWSADTRYGRLICTHRQERAVERCPRFEYEPGTDEGEVERRVIRQAKFSQRNK